MPGLERVGATGGVGVIDLSSDSGDLPRSVKSSAGEKRDKLRKKFRDVLGRSETFLPWLEPGTARVEPVGVEALEIGDDALQRGVTGRVVMVVERYGRERRIGTLKDTSWFDQV